MVNRLLLGVAILVAALVGAQAPAAARHEGVRVSGTYSVTHFGTISCGPKAGSPHLISCTTTGFVSRYSGSLTGRSVASFTQSIDCANSTTQGHGVETFTGSIAGVGSGTLTWGIRFSAGFDCSTFSVLTFAGLGEIRSGTGDLARLRGVLEFGIDTYAGTLG